MCIVILGRRRRRSVSALIPVGPGFLIATDAPYNSQVGIQSASLQIQFWPSYGFKRAAAAWRARLPLRCSLLFARSLLLASSL